MLQKSLAEAYSNARREYPSARAGNMRHPSLHSNDVPGALKSTSAETETTFCVNRRRMGSDIVQGKTVLHSFYCVNRKYCVHELRATSLRICSVLVDRTSLHM